MEARKPKRIIRGCIARNVPTQLSYAGRPPRTREEQLELTQSQLQQIMSSIHGLPVITEHGVLGGQRVGQVVKGELVQGSAFVDIQLDDNVNGETAYHFVSGGILKGLSLCHNSRTLVPAEISLCREGARPGTEIMEMVMASKRQPPDHKEAPLAVVSQMEPTVSLKVSELRALLAPERGELRGTLENPAPVYNPQLVAASNTAEMATNAPAPNSAYTNNALSTAVAAQQGMVAMGLSNQPAAPEPTQQQIAEHHAQQLAARGLVEREPQYVPTESREANGEPTAKRARTLDPQQEAEVAKPVGEMTPDDLMEVLAGQRGQLSDETKAALINHVIGKEQMIEELKQKLLEEEKKGAEATQSTGALRKQVLETIIPFLQSTLNNSLSDKQRTDMERTMMKADNEFVNTWAPALVAASAALGGRLSNPMQPVPPVLSKSQQALQAWKALRAPSQQQPPQQQYYIPAERAYQAPEATQQMLPYQAQEVNQQMQFLQQQRQEYQAPQYYQQPQQQYAPPLQQQPMVAASAGAAPRSRTSVLDELLKNTSARDVNVTHSDEVLRMLGHSKK